jgi:hypothetical protein
MKMKEENKNKKWCTNWKSRKAKERFGKNEDGETR